MLDVLEAIARSSPRDRDRVADAKLGIAGPTSSAPPGTELVGYHPSGVASIVRMLVEVPVTERDVFVDLGSGLGKVVLLTHLLTGAKARGVEMQLDLVRRARAAAERSRAEVEFVRADVRTVGSAFLEDGTVFFLYLPFTGSALDEVLARLRVVAERRTIVVCTLGLDLDRAASWLRRRPLDAFWLAVYDSTVPGAAPLPERTRSPRLGPLADAIAFER